MSSRPEAWQRGPVPGIPDQLQPVAHALIGAAEDASDAVSGLGPSQVWLSPGGAASIGFHLRHLSGSTDRLFTYARGAGLSDGQKAALAAERILPDPRPEAAGLVRAWQETWSDPSVSWRRRPMASWGRRAVSDAWRFPPTFVACCSTRRSMPPGTSARSSRPPTLSKDWQTSKK